MEMGSPEWIEESLARLESMEQERDQHEGALETATDADALREHSEAIDRLDEQIKALYEQLESVAGEEESEEADDVDDVIRTSPFERDETPAAAEPVAPVEDNPLAAAPAAAPAVEELEDNPFGAPSRAPSSPAAAAPAASFAVDTPAVDTSYDFDEKGGGMGKWVVIAVLLIGGGVGGFMFYKNQNKPAPVPTAPAEARVIEASTVPDDTQGPKGAKGADADRTPEREYTGGKRRSGGGGGKGRTRNASSSRGKSSGKGAIELKSGDDPLG